MTIKISVITVTKNCINTIASTVHSLESQDYYNKEYIWVDGSSTDGTAEYLRSHSANKNCIFISEDDRGIYDALNKGIYLATGDVIGFLHSDDIFSDSTTLTQIADAFRDIKVNAVYGDLDYVNNNFTKIIRHWSAGSYGKSKLYYGWMPPHPTLYLRKVIYDRFGHFDTKLKISSDYDFILRIFSSEYISALYIPKVLIKMRIGGVSNRSIVSICKKSYEDYQALKKNNVGNLKTVIYKNIRKLIQFL